MIRPVYPLYPCHEAAPHIRPGPNQHLTDWIEDPIDGVRSTESDRLSHRDLDRFELDTSRESAE